MDSKSPSLARMILRIIRMTLHLLRLRILLLISQLSAAYGGLRQQRRPRPNE